MYVYYIISYPSNQMQFKCTKYLLSKLVYLKFSFFILSFCTFISYNVDMILLEEVAFWGSKEETRPLTLEEQNARRLARKDFKKWVLLEEVFQRQKPRELWLKEGDKNIGFFHKMANAHRRRNYLVRIKINGHQVSEGRKIKEGVVQVFQSLLAENGGPSCSGLTFDVLGDDEAVLLEVLFFEVEVFKVLLDLNGDKAPSPDDFSLDFWQFNWDFVKDEVMGVFGSSMSMVDS